MRSDSVSMRGGIGSPPGVTAEGAPLHRTGLVVGVEARADRAVALAHVEEPPDLPTTGQAVPPTFRSHVIGLPDDGERPVVPGERLQRLPDERAGFVTRPIHHRR